MTTVDDVYKSYQSFKSSGIKNQQITLFGWSKEGYLYQSPYKPKNFK